MCPALDAPDMQRIIGWTLAASGISHHCAGFPPLATSVEAYIEHGAQNCRLTVDIYPKVAALYGMPPSAVERGIRSAIRRAWAVGALERFLQDKEMHSGRCPSNREFIHKIAYIVTLLDV